MADHRPLHLLMRDAYTKAVQTSPGRRVDGEAAMLCALADEVVPEEPEPSLTDSWMARLEWERWAQRKATRALLLKAADEAEGRWQ
jgi:hypothetical protein